MLVGRRRLLPPLRRRLGSSACCRRSGPFRVHLVVDHRSPRRVLASVSVVGPLRPGCIGRSLADAWPPISSLTDALPSLLLGRMLCRRCRVGWLLQVDALPLWL